MLENCNKEMAMLPLPNGKFQFNELGIIIAQENGFKEGWKECCKWFLELVKEYTYTGDNGGNCVDISELKEKMENATLDATLGIVNEAVDCIYRDTCKRGCKCNAAGSPVWLYEGDAHRCRGWISCSEHKPKTIIYHCAHLCNDGYCVWRKPGEAMHKCIGYQNCDDYVAGDEEIK